jgi:hypothetical protein
MTRRDRDTEIPSTSSDVRPSKTVRMKASVSDDLLASMGASTCWKCTSVAIGENCSCFVLGCGSKCRVCVDCFSQMVLCLAETSIMTCPCCESTIDSWRTNYPLVRGSRARVRIVKGTSNFQLPEISSRLDPIRYHGNMSSPEKVIGISVSSSKDGDISS